MHRIVSTKFNFAKILLQTRKFRPALSKHYIYIYIYIYIYVHCNRDTTHISVKRIQKNGFGFVETSLNHGYNVAQIITLNGRGNRIQKRPNEKNRS